MYPNLQLLFFLFYQIVFTTDFCQVYSYCACDAAGMVMFTNITDLLPDSAAMFQCLLSGRFGTLHDGYDQVALGRAAGLE